jgi:UDP-N-acetylglucosamine--N-acetylmuramyl-(pentapeptide) pyrophosphoryl-undecaprenol N-acetylglucosamine transferase
VATVGLVCGPTGGHLVPASLVANSVQQKGEEAVLFTDLKPSFHNLVNSDLPVTSVNVSPWANQSIMGKLESLSSIGIEYFRLRHRVRALDAVISFGGYTAVPILLAARETSVPIYIQEQNRVLGRANQLFVKHAQQIFQGLPLNEKPTRDAKLTGNPVRTAGSPEEDWFDQSPLLVVVGGSQGSRNVSQYLAETAPLLLDQGWAIYYVRGDNGLDLTNKDWSNQHRFRQVKFNPELNNILPTAQVIWSRAGAGSVAEIIQYQRPALLFPLPGAADNHQSLNAHWLSQSGPASVVSTDANEVEPDKLIRRTEHLLEYNRNYEVPWNQDETAQDTIARTVLTRTS